MDSENTVNVVLVVTSRILTLTEKNRTTESMIDVCNVSGHSYKY
jgi:hypothetical protein